MCSISSQTMEDHQEKNNETDQTDSVNNVADKNKLLLPLNSQSLRLSSPRVMLSRCETEECKECSRVFVKDSKQYYFHKISHTRERLKKQKMKAEEPTDKRFIKKLQCPDCDARFVQMSTLQTHSIVHKPFPNVCHCGIGYYKKSDLKGHQKLMHGPKSNVEEWIPKIALKQKTEKEKEKTNKKRKRVL